FEPATPSSRTRCSTRLSHTPTAGRTYNGGSPWPQAHEVGRDCPAVNTRHDGERRSHNRSHALPRGGPPCRVPQRQTLPAPRLGADATNSRAVARLYHAKGRPAFNPLISHVPDVAAARRLAAFDVAAARLAEAFWPGPLTLVLPRLPGCPVAELATAGLDTIAL